MKILSYPQKLTKGLTLLCLTCLLQSFAKEIHVSRSNGTNATNGRGSESAPYKSINYLFTNHSGIGKLVSPGDIIIVHKGTYRETIDINVDNVTLKSFGDDRVIVTGCNWYGKDKWTKDDDPRWNKDGVQHVVYKMTLNNSLIEPDFTQLFVNTPGNPMVHQQIARYPNNESDYKKYIIGGNKEMMSPMDNKTGFATLLNANKPEGEHAVSKVTFSGHHGVPEIPKGAFTDEAIIRGFIGKLRNNIFSYTHKKGAVTREGNRLVSFKSYQTQGNNWAANAKYSAPEGFGYIMDLNMLDYEGEWFYKRKANTIYYMPTGKTMDDKSFEIRLRQYVLKVNADDAKFENIRFMAGEVELKNAKRTSFSKCSFTYMNPFHYRTQYGVFTQGIVLEDADNTNFDSCYIGHTWGSGIIINNKRDKTGNLVWSSDNTTINNCIIEDIGWMGQFTLSVLNNGKNTTMTKNTFGRASRFHIRSTESVKMTILDNDFYQAMCMGEDAGSIMFTSTGKADALNMQETVIAYNKIHDINGIPAYDTDPAGYNRQKIVALYLEDVDNYTAHHNVVYNIKGDTYTSVRKDKNGQVEETESKGDVMYLGPRNRKLTRDIKYYNNTFWNYDYLLTFWHRTVDGRVDNLHLKNNITQKDKPSLILKKSEKDLNEFIKYVAEDPLNYTITSEKDVTVTDPLQHFSNASIGNLRLKNTSLFLSGGVPIEGITEKDNLSPSRGAWEGATNYLRSRVFRAGSNITSETFGEEDPTLDTDNVIKEVKPNTILYPNPFKDYIHIAGINPNEKIVVTLKNINGVIIYKSYSTKNVEIELDTQSIPKGVYFVEIISPTQQHVQKVIKI